MAYSRWEASQQRRARPFMPQRMPTLIPAAELARITCDVRAGDGVDHETAVRLLEHIEILVGVVRNQASRREDVDPGVVHARVESRTPDLPESVGRTNR